MNLSLGDNIRSKRKALHLSQEALGEMTGSNRVTISRYENNEYNPSVPALYKLAIALQTTPAELAGEEWIRLQANEPTDGNVSVMTELFQKLSSAGQQEILSHTAWLLSKREQ